MTTRPPASLVLLIAVGTFAAARSCTPLEAPPGAALAPVPAAPPPPDELTTAMRRLAAGDPAEAARVLARASAPDQRAERADRFAAPMSPSLSRDGSRAAFRMGGMLRVFDVRAGREVGHVPIPVGDREDETFYPTTFELSPDGARLAFRRANERYDLELWDLARAARIASFPTACADANACGDGSIAFDPEGKRIAFRVEALANRIVVADAATGVVRCVARAASAAGDVRFEDGGSVVRGGRESFRASDCGPLPAPPDEIREARPKPVRAGAEGLRLSDASPKQAGERLLRAEPGTWTVRLSADHRTLAAQSDTGAVRAWDVATGEPLFVASTAPRERSVQALGFTSDGETLVLATGSGGEEQLALHRGTTRSISDVGPAVIAAVSRAGVVAAVLSSPELGLSVGIEAWDREVPLRGTSGAEVVAAAFGTETTLGVVYSPSGAQAESETHVFDLETGKRRRKLPILGTTSIAFDPSGKQLATASSLLSHVAVWDTSTGALRAELEAPNEAIAFSPDGKLLAYASYDDLHVLDVAAKRDLCATPKGPPVSRFFANDPLIAFSADGSRVLAIRGAHATLFGARDCAVVEELPALPEVPSALAVHPGRPLFVAGTRSGALYLLRPGTDPAWLTVATARAAAAAFSEGRVELVGEAARSLARCAVRGYSFPLELCEDDEVITRGLLAPR